MLKNQFIANMLLKLIRRSLRSDIRILKRMADYYNSIGWHDAATLLLQAAGEIDKRSDEFE